MSGKQSKVAVLQLRKKTTDTGLFIQKAKKLLEITWKYNVPLLINDRVDVALASGADGIHVGQDDMDLKDVRRLLEPDAIIGTYVGSFKEAKVGITGHADYFGLGPIWDTNTKKLTKPLPPHMTNDVAKNLQAKVSLAIGVSPIMSENVLEAADLAKINGALLLNIGTTDPESPAAMLEALQIANTAGTPVLLDSVGAGATRFRKDTVAEFLASGYCDIIKGNETEIRALLNLPAQARGVDSLHSSSSSSRAELASTLARREQNTVVVSGAVDVVSDGDRTFCVSNGDAMLGFITGSGCTLGTVIAACAAVEEDKCVAAVAGCVAYGIAAERAVRREEVKGPGTFQAVLVDEIWRIRGECVGRATSIGSRERKPPLYKVG
ncbi:thiamine biosynthetic bifunctional enzyme [Saitoella coloradoensis]